MIASGFSRITAGWCGRSCRFRAPDLRLALAFFADEVGVMGRLGKDGGLGLADDIASRFMIWLVRSHQCDSK